MGRRKNDIERYLKGQMTAAEMHALEREALHDPFLSEALEGIDEAGKETFLYDLQQLSSTLSHRTGHTKKRRHLSMSVWTIGIAASLLLVAASSVFIIIDINHQREERQLAKLELQKDIESREPAPGAVANADSTLEKTTPDKQLSKVPDEKPLTRKPASRPALENPTASVQENGDDVSDGETAIVSGDIERDRSAADVTRPEAQDDKAGAARKQPAAAPSGIADIVRVVRGKVTSSEDNKGLPGVNVIVQGTNTGTITDSEGNYEITVNDARQKLMFAFIGLESKEAQVIPGQNLNVVMNPDLAALSEVVVTGAGEKAEDHPTLEFAAPEGGRHAFQKYLEKTMNYPEQALDNKVEGGVEVQFTVNPNGQLTDFTVLKGLGFGCDDEVIRLIKEGPAWSPSKKGDKAVQDKVKVRLKFDLPD
jgi:TonB family protein